MQNRANKMSVSKWTLPIKIFILKRALTMDFFVQAITWRKVESQDSSYSDDDVLTISDSDSDILVTIEKADIVEFLENDSSTLAGFQEEIST